MILFETLTCFKWKLDHLKTSNNGILLVLDVFTCKYCELAFITAEYCQKHETKCGYIVPDAPSASTSKESTVAELNKEEKDASEEEQLYQCDKCSDRFKTKGALYLHTCRNSEVALHICNVCDKQFHLPSQLKRHKCNLDYKCPKCDRVFNKKCGLKAHWLTHLPTEIRKHKCKKKLDYKCPKCDKMFCRKSELQIHWLTHYKQYQCTQCDLSFQSLLNLKKHVFSHGDEHEFKCPNCNIIYKTFQSFKIHVKRPFRCTYAHKLTPKQRRFKQLSDLEAARGDEK